MPLACAAKDCSSIIALSKITRSVVHDQSEVQQYASNFCSEYAAHHGASNSASFVASYKFLSATFASGSASVDDVASKYCSAVNQGSASSEAYSSYIESIAPGAYSAYNKCEANPDLNFDVDEAGVLPSQFSVNVSFQAAGNQSAKLLATPSQGVTCTWNQKNSATIVLNSPASATLSCARADVTHRSFVTIARTDGASSFTMPWGAYTKEGVPVDLVQKLQASVSSALSQMKSSFSVIRDAQGQPQCMGYFDVQICWGEAVVTNEVWANCCSWIHKVNARFSRKFADTPSVNYSIFVNNSSGTLYSLYGFDIKTDEWSGTLRRVHPPETPTLADDGGFKTNPPNLRVYYTAIGRRTP